MAHLRQIIKDIYKRVLSNVKICVLPSNQCLQTLKMCAINSLTNCLQIVVKTCWLALQKIYYCNCTHEEEVLHLSQALPI